MLFMHFGRIASCLGFRSISLSLFPQPLTVHTESQTPVDWWANNPVNICRQWQVMVRWDHDAAHTHKLTNSQHTNQHCHAAYSSILYLSGLISVCLHRWWQHDALLGLYNLGSPDLLTITTHTQIFLYFLDESIWFELFRTVSSAC